MSHVTDPKDQDEKRARAVAFGVKVYVDTFAVPPPTTAAELEARLADLEDTFVSNPIQQALDLASYDAFVAEVNAALAALTVH